MTARSPSAFLLSASLHGLVAAVIILFTYMVQTQVKEAPTVLELVAGPGDDYGATAAPAAGVAGGVKIEIPEPPAPAPVKVAAPPPVAAPEPIPVVKAAPVEKTVTKTPPKPTEVKPPNFSRQIKNKIIRAESKAKLEIKKERAAEQKRISKAEFDKQYRASKTAAARRDPKVKHVDAEGIAGGVVGGSTASKSGAGGKALTREEGDLLDAYFSIVKQKLRDGLEKPPGLGDAITAVAEFRLNADGSISGARITRSSGSDEFDRAVLDDIRRFTRVTPPKAWQGDTVSLTFRMKEEDDD